MTATRSTSSGLAARARLSGRLPPDAHANALTRALERLRADGTPYVDLTASNPTVAGLAYPDDLLAPLGDPRGLQYDPHPFGLRSAREAVAADYARRGACINPDDVVLTASTSEAYAWLFKLMCDPGDIVLVPRPSYPLFEHLTALEAVVARPYDLEYHGRWAVDFAALEESAGNTRVRAVVVVAPNNPTGSYLSAAEVQRLGGLCRQNGWTIIADEVFADYRLETPEPVTDLATTAEVLTFSLGGASKTLGLPQVKLGWMAAGGPPAARRQALQALAFIADAYLSVSTPVQLAAPVLLDRSASVREAIHHRLRVNLAQARAIVREHPSCELLRVEGGWSAVLRVPARAGDEQLALQILEGLRVLVHPGFFFDFPRGCFLVVSLLPPPETFADAFGAIVRAAA